MGGAPREEVLPLPGTSPASDATTTPGPETVRRGPPDDVSYSNTAPPRTDAFLAGVLAGFVSDLVLHPLDHLKCLLQTTGATSFKTKPWLLYRGFPAVAVLGAPGNGVFYGVYETCMNRGVQPLFASSCASVCASLVYCPMEVVKETAYVHKLSTLGALRKVTSHYSRFSPLYRGLGLANLTWVPYLGMYFCVFEALKGDDRSEEKSTFGKDLACGLCAGGVAATATYPVDVWKTKSQAGVLKINTSTFFSRFSLIDVPLKQHLQAVLMRNLWLAPASALTISFYRQFMTLLSTEGNKELCGHTEGNKELCGPQQYQWCKVVERAQKTYREKVFFVQLNR